MMTRENTFNCQNKNINKIVFSHKPVKLYGALECFIRSKDATLIFATTLKKSI